MKLLEDWTNLAKLVTEAGADMIELNFSCPQMTSHTMGSDVGTNPELCKKNCEAVKRGTSLPVLAKMTPNITTMVPVGKACLERRGQMAVPQSIQLNQLLMLI